uniref:K Homology domain-containing protein n=1 Tax=Arion vulgaris TaxID=1028688 RepID=A0A0B7BP49_9EUPU
MAQTGTYSEELENELKQTDPNSHANRLIAQEIDRLTKGEDDKKDRPPVVMIELHHERPQKCSIKIRVPVKEYPRYNFVGKLLGPKGTTLKALQDQTGCKMAIMGKGSMREKEKEEELRKEGGKYAHLNEDLHILVECYTEMTDGYYRLAAALAELKKFIIPEMTDDMYGGPEGGEMAANGGAPRGRGGYRGAPPERGGRGGFRGRGNGPVPPPGGRGAPPSRVPRGAPRGAPSGRGAPPTRGAPPSRGARSAAPAASYDGYSSQGYGSGYGSGYDTTYDEGYGQSYPSGQEASYYDYGGPSSSSAAGYDSYSGAAAYDYGDSWSSGGKVAPPSSRGSSRGQARSHPYTRSATNSSY